MGHLVHDRYPKKVCCAVLCAIVWTGATVTGYGEDPAIAKSVASGTVEGSVIYHADSKRPWRYSRYYIKDAKSGELAEAVVALHGKGLSLPRDREPATVKIDQKNFQFLPETVAIRRGDSVTFTNSDQATHNVQSSGDLANFNVTIPAGGEGYAVRFDRAGGIRRPAEVGCVFHSNMRAWVFVFDHGCFQINESRRTVSVCRSSSGRIRAGDGASRRWPSLAAKDRSKGGRCALR